MTGKVSQVDIALLSSWLSPTGVPRLVIHHHPVTARLHAPNCLTAVPFGIPDMLSPNRVHPMFPAFTLSGSAQSGTTLFVALDQSSQRIHAPPRSYTDSHRNPHTKRHLISLTSSLG